MQIFNKDDQKAPPNQEPIFPKFSFLETHSSTNQKQSVQYRLASSDVR